MTDDFNIVLSPDEWNNFDNNKLVSLDFSKYNGFYDLDIKFMDLKDLQEILFHRYQKASLS